MSEVPRTVKKFFQMPNVAQKLPSTIGTSLIGGAHGCLHVFPKAKDRGLAAPACPVGAASLHMLQRTRQTEKREAVEIG